MHQQHLLSATRYSAIVQWGMFCLLVMMADAAIASPFEKLANPARVSHGFMVETSYGLAAIAALGVGFLAFSGRFTWKWLIALIGSLAVVVTSAQIVGFFTPAAPAVAVPGLTNAGTSLATAQGVTGQAQVLASDASESGKFIAYGIAGVGAIGIALLGFLGKWKFPWLWSLVGGLAIIASFPDVSFFVDDSYQAGLAPATGRDPFTQAGNLTNNTTDSFKFIVYGLAGAGALGLAVMAFVGQWKWRWFWMLIAGLAIAGGAQQLVDYIGVTP